MLIQAGAKAMGDEVILAAEYLHPELLLAVLASGGDPNATTDDGLTGLQLALAYMYKQSQRKLQRGIKIVEILLEKGAKLVQGEVVSAIRIGKWDLVDLLLSHGGSLKDTKYSGLTALEAAISSRDNYGLSRIFATHKRAYDAGSLCAAVENEMDECVDRLLANRPSQQDPNILEATAIGIASRSDNMNLLLKLLSRLPHMNRAVVPIQMDEMGGLFAITDSHWWRRNYGTDGSPLALAAFDRSRDAFSELLKRGYQADQLTWTIVANSNDLLMAQALVEYNQQLGGNTAQSEIPICNPLIGAIKFQNKELIQLLLKVGADVNDHNRDLINSRSPLQLAVELGDLDIIECLLEAGAEINAPAAFQGGGTALQLAAISGNLGLAKYLLDRGAQVNAPSALRFGRTALEGAAEHGRLDMLKLLLCDGALITDAGRRQYVRSIKLARKKGHYASEELLRETREWSEDDEILFNDENLLNEGSIDDSAIWTTGEKHEVDRVEVISEAKSMGHPKLYLWM